MPSSLHHLHNCCLCAWQLLQHPPHAGTPSTPQHSSLEAPHSSPEGPSRTPSFLQKAAAVARLRARPSSLRHHAENPPPAPASPRPHADSPLGIPASPQFPGAAGHHRKLSHLGLGSPRHSLLSPFASASLDSTGGRQAMALCTQLGGPCMAALMEFCASLQRPHCCCLPLFWGGPCGPPSPSQPALARNSPPLATDSWQSPALSSCHSTHAHTCPGQAPACSTRPQWPPCPSHLSDAASYRRTCRTERSRPTLISSVAKQGRHAT